MNGHTWMSLPFLLIFGLAEIARYALKRGLQVVRQTVATCSAGIVSLGGREKRYMAAFLYRVPSSDMICFRPNVRYADSRLASRILYRFIIYDAKARRDYVTFLQEKLECRLNGAILGLYNLLD